MLRKTLAITALATLTLVAPSLADRDEHRYRPNKRAHKVLRSESRDLAVAARQLRVAIENGYRPWSRFQFIRTLDAADRFEREARRFDRDVRKKRLYPREYARRLDRVSRSYRDLDRSLRFGAARKWLRVEILRTRDQLRRVRSLVNGPRLSARYDRSYRRHGDGYRYDDDHYEDGRYDDDHRRPRKFGRHRGDD